MSSLTALTKPPLIKRLISYRKLQFKPPTEEGYNQSPIQNEDEFDFTEISNIQIELKAILADKVMKASLKYLRELGKRRRKGSPKKTSN
jgi:hypothetical protein